MEESCTTSNLDRFWNVHVKKLDLFDSVGQKIYDFMKRTRNYYVL